MKVRKREEEKGKGKWKGEKGEREREIWKVSLPFSMYVSGLVSRGAVDLELEAAVSNASLKSVVDSLVPFLEVGVWVVGLG